MKKILAIILLCLPLSGCWTYQKGNGRGQIIGVWQSGFFVKTWECKIIIGGLDDGSGTIGKSIDYTIENEEQAKKAHQLMLKKATVTFSFHNEITSFLRSDSDSKFIYSIDEIKKD